jgi:hypothetical protein
MQACRIPGAIPAAIALACTLAVLPAAHARDIRITAPTPAPATAPPSTADDAENSPTLQPLTPEDSALLGRVLAFDPANPTSLQSVPTLHEPGFIKPPAVALKRTDNADGSSTITVKQPLVTSTVETNVGADINTAASAPTVLDQPERALPGTGDSHGSGVAWASIGVPNLASIDGRVDPTNEQGKVTTTFNHSVALGDKMKVTVQCRYSVTETYNPPETDPSAAIGGLPLAVAPAPDPTSTTAQPSPQVWDSDKSVKLDIQSTGTTLTADITTASNDPVTHNTFSADQKIYGPLHVTTAVSDLGQPVPNKSITAGFTLNW